MENPQSSVTQQPRPFPTPQHDPDYDFDRGTAAQPKQPMGFAEATTNTCTLIVVPPSAIANDGTIIKSALRPDSHMILACVTFWLCNLPMGATAFIFSMLSEKAADDDDLVRAQCWGNLAKWISVIGIFSSVLCIIALVIRSVTLYLSIIGQ